MTTFDFSPLYRTSVGFDRLASLLSSAQRVEQGAYPPYNILAVDENHYQIFGGDLIERRALGHVQLSW